MAGRIASFYSTPPRAISPRRRSSLSPQKAYSSYGSRTEKSPFEARTYYRSTSLTNSIPPSTADASSTTSSSNSRLHLHINLSTGSPSDKADGEAVDREIEKLRRLSVDYQRSNEVALSQESLRSPSQERSPSPQRNIPIIPGGNSFFSRSVSREPEYSIRSRSPSPARTFVQEERPPYRRTTSIESEARYRDLRSRSPSPSPRRASKGRASVPFSYSSGDRSSFLKTPDAEPQAPFSLKARSPSPRERVNAALDRQQSFRRSSSQYDGDPHKFYSLRARSQSPAPHHQAPSSNIFKRSTSYESDERLRNFRPRSTSPNGLNPALSYYRKGSGNVEDSDSGFSQTIRSRSPSPNRALFLQNLFKPKNSNLESAENYRKYCAYHKIGTPEPHYNNRSYGDNRNVIKDSYGTKFNTLSRGSSRFYNRSPSPSPLGEDFFTNLFKRNSIDSHNILNNSANSKDNYNFANHNNNRLNGPSSKPPIIPYNNLKKKFEEPTSPITNTAPDFPSFKMPGTQRRFSEEPTAYRRPLAPLFEDEVTARRRFSDDIRKKSYDTSGVNDDLYEYQRRMSEAGVRKISDASVVLNEDTDSFIIGDRVWVGGTKPGVISYIGETQFAPGDWAGVTLDDFIGKNDGSVGGIRYFQCESKKGVFSRLTRLSRTPLSDEELDLYASRGGSISPKSGTPAPSSSTKSYTATPIRRPSAGTPARTTPNTSSSIRKNSGPPSADLGDFKIGDRVVINSVSGVKFGILRFSGKTEFAPGLWAGVELEEPTGKNNGSVAGKKYFVCREKYGLFSPLGRISKFTGPPTSRRASGYTMPPPSSSIPSLKRTGSKESVGTASVSSSTTASVKGGIFAIRRPSRASASGSVPSTKALEDDHIVDEDGFY